MIEKIPIEYSGYAICLKLIKELWCQILKVESKGTSAMPVIEKKLDFAETTY